MFCRWWYDALSLLLFRYSIWQCSRLCFQRIIQIYNCLCWLCLQVSDSDIYHCGDVGKTLISAGRRRWQLVDIGSKQSSSYRSLMFLYKFAADDCLSRSTKIRHWCGCCEFGHRTKSYRQTDRQPTALAMSYHQQLASDLAGDRQRCGRSEIRSKNSWSVFDACSRTVYLLVSQKNGSTCQKLRLYQRIKH